MNEKTLTALVARFQARESDRTFARIYAEFEGLLVVLADARSGHRDDLIQEAALGLLEAVRTFDPSRGVPFKAYARKRARWAVSKACRPISRHHDNTVHSEADRHGSATADALELVHARNVERGLSPLKKAVLDGIVRGEAGQDIAKRTGISAGRVSQLKSELIAEIRG